MVESPRAFPPRSHAARPRARGIGRALLLVATLAAVAWIAFHLR
ncbi:MULTISPECIES: hypothetical protein [Methylobacterium]|jgi:hypothetical protein|nr:MULTISPECIES: hypothetical protein [Methylobacterium]